MDEDDFNENSRREPGTEGKKKGMALLIYDLKHRELIPVKVLTFIFFAGRQCCSVFVLADKLSNSFICLS
jgi:hypothetical protein